MFGGKRVRSRSQRRNRSTNVRRSKNVRRSRSRSGSRSRNRRTRSRSRSGSRKRARRTRRRQSRGGGYKIRDGPCNNGDLKRFKDKMCDTKEELEVNPDGTSKPGNSTREICECTLNPF